MPRPFKNQLFAAIALASAMIVSSTCAQNLPPLTATNLGVFAVSGTMSVTNNDPGINSSYSILGGGNELWGDLDHGEFASYLVTGDFDVRVRVDSLQPVHRYAKAGLIVREDVQTTNRMVSIFATPTGPTELPADTPVGSDNVEFNFRRAPNDGKNSVNLGSPGFPNAWLRLARRGNIFYGMLGPDGTNWNISGSVDTSSWPGRPFPTNAFLGLGVSSHDDARTVQSEFRQFGGVNAVGPIRFSQQPANAFVTVGHPLTLSAAVGDPVDASFQWFTNDVAIPGATNLTYTTPNITPSDNGQIYKLTATGSQGTTTSSNATVQVISIAPPENPIAVFDFDDGELPPGTAVYGTALVDPAAGFGGTGGLILTTNRNDQNGSFIIDDLNPGSAVDSFTVAFKLKIGPGSANAADGVSLSFGNNLPNGTFVAPQQGVGPGLAIAFDLYDNGNLEAPAIDVFYGVDPAQLPQNLAGNIVHQPIPKTRLVNARYVDVVVHMGADGKLDLAYDGTVIANHVQTPYVPVTGARFGFGGYCGGQNALQAIDSISIETTTQTTQAYLQSLLPLGNAVPAATEIIAQLTDLSTLVDTNSIKLNFNSSPVTPIVAKEGDLTTVRYPVPGLLTPNSTNTATLLWSDNGAPANAHTNTISFKVANYVTLPASAALPSGSGSSTNSGFKVKIYQVGSPLDATSSSAEAALAGRLGANIAATSGANAEGYFTDVESTSVIDYDVNPGQTGVTFPGIPGSSASKENFAGEILAYIEFPTAGYYQMAIRSDDGFKLWAGALVASNAVPVAAFEGAREPSDTIFGFQVPTPGLYPFRLLYYQATGGASLLWSSVSADGHQALINDTSHADAILAFRSVEGSASPPPTLNVERTALEAVLTWTATAVLEVSSELPGHWVAVPGAVSPYRVALSGKAFYRLRQ